MRWTSPTPLVASVLVASAVLRPVPATAGDEMPRIESTLDKSDQVKLFKDADLKEDAGVAAVAEVFPTNVLKETFSEAVQIQFKGVNYWVDGGKLRIKRPRAAKCLTVTRQVATAADRSANEGCAKQVGDAAPTTMPPKKSP